MKDLGFCVVGVGAVGAKEREARPYAGGVEDLDGRLRILPVRMIGEGEIDRFALAKGEAGGRARGSAAENL